MLIAGVPSAFAQKGNLTLREIIDLVECKKISCFDEKVKELGFRYTSVSQEPGKKGYLYNRTISANGYDVKQSVFFYDYNNNTPKVMFGTMATAEKDYCDDIRSKAKKYEFTEASYSPEKTDDGKSWFFTNEKYKLEIHDLKMAISLTCILYRSVI